MIKNVLLLALVGGSLTCGAVLAQDNKQPAKDLPTKQKSFTGANKTRIDTPSLDPRGSGAEYDWHGMPALVVTPKPIEWMSDNGLSSDAINLINTVGAIADEGLDPQAYYYDELIRTHDTNPTRLDSTAVAGLFDKVFLKLVNDLGRGIVDPTQTQAYWFRPATGVDAQSMLRQFKSGSLNFEQILDKTRPQHPMYQAQVSMLKKLRRQSRHDQIFVVEGESIEPGVNSPRTLELKQALLNLGDLTAYAILDENYDNDLAAAINAFQTRHGLAVDGKAGKATITAVNTPIQERIEQVALNLERWRWMPNTLEDTHILVNLPEYRVRMTIDNEQALDMNVVIGKPDNQTPVFSENMSHLVFAPTWTVPSSITNKELVPLERENPGHLARQNIDVFKWKGNKLSKVSHDVLTPEVLNREKFPYVLRQAAGAGNALGKVKFMMPNKHSIYLHDTQSKGLFAKAKRAFSHGCIRLAEPELMANTILQLDGIGQDQVYSLMNRKKTKSVNLKEKIPVHMIYMTAWQDENGDMHFRNDIYKHDIALNKAFDRKSQQDVILAQIDQVKTTVATAEVADFTER